MQLEGCLIIKEMKKLHFVLSVDDERICHFLTQRMLARLDAADIVEEASNGVEAIRILRHYKKVFNICPELILLDINMPMMNGLEFAKTISEYAAENNCRVVVVTTSSHPYDYDALCKLGITEIYAKPLTNQKLVEILSKERPVDEPSEGCTFQLSTMEGVEGTTTFS